MMLIFYFSSWVRVSNSLASNGTGKKPRSSDWPSDYFGIFNAKKCCCDFLRDNLAKKEEAMSGFQSNNHWYGSIKQQWAGTYHQSIAFRAVRSTAVTDMYAAILLTLVAISFYGIRAEDDEPTTLPPMEPCPKTWQALQPKFLTEVTEEARERFDAIIADKSLSIAESEDKLSKWAAEQGEQIQVSIPCGKLFPVAFSWFTCVHFAASTVTTNCNLLTWNTEHRLLRCVGREALIKQMLSPSALHSRKPSLEDVRLFRMVSSRSFFNLLYVLVTVL